MGETTSAVTQTEQVDNYLMDNITALHTAARRYCLTRDAITEIFDMRVLPPGRRAPTFVTDDAEGIVLGAICLEVERVLPSDFASLENLRAFLLTTGRTVPAYPIHPSTLTPQDVQAAMEAAREDFCASIEHLAEEELRHIAPLPYRRVLGLRERERLWQRLKRRWDAPKLTTYWYPLIEGAPPAHAAAFYEGPFNRAIPPDRLQAILAQGRVRRVLELHTGSMHNQYGMDLSLLHPWDWLSEQYWTSEKMDWLLYHSHANSLTVAGEWFVSGVPRAGPEWEQHLYPPRPHYRIWNGQPVRDVSEIEW